MGKRKNILQVTKTDWPGGFKDYFGQASMQKAADLYTELQKPLVKPMQLGVTSRVFNYWKIHFNLDVIRGEHKRFSFYEIVWVRMVQQLLGANFTTANINTILSQLTKPLSLKGVLTKKDKVEHLLAESQLSKEQQQQLLSLLNAAQFSDTPQIQINLLHIIIMESILKKLPLSIAVFLDGSIMIVDNTKGFLYSEADRQKLFFESHFILSISGIIKTFLASDLSGFVLPQIAILPPAETKLFEWVHSGKYESITIHFKDKKINSVELKKSVDIKTKLVDLLHLGDFGHITIKKHRGEIVRIENNEKISL